MLEILEVSPRDGLQNESLILSLEDKLEFVSRLAETGLKRIELGAFVSPKWVPQMEHSKSLALKILQKQKKGAFPSVQFSALVPNEKGLNQAIEAGLSEIAVFLSATDSFSKKNLNRERKEAYKIYQALCKKALAEKIKIRAYLSVCFDCPFEGAVSFKDVASWTQKIEDLGVYEISICDTTGKARPEEVSQLLDLLLKVIPKEKIACHFHNIHGMALSNVFCAYEKGIRVFDGSLAGLGGCPYSKIPSGNVATESLIYLLKGAKDPVIPKLIKLAHWLEQKLNKKLPSQLIHSPYYKT